MLAVLFIVSARLGPNVFLTCLKPTIIHFNDSSSAFIDHGNLALCVAIICMIWLKSFSTARWKICKIKCRNNEAKIFILGIITKVSILHRLLTILKGYMIYCYLLGKGGYVFGSVGLSVCLSVCLSVNNITQKVMNGLG